MPKYTYHFYESPDLIASTFVVYEPLPHIEVGHQLILSTGDYPEKNGIVLVVEYVRVRVRHRKSEELQLEIHVFCREQVSPPPP